MTTRTLNDLLQDENNKAHVAEIGLGKMMAGLDALASAASYLWAAPEQLQVDHYIGFVSCGPEAMEACESSLSNDSSYSSYSSYSSPSALQFVCVNITTLRHDGPDQIDDNAIHTQDPFEFVESIEKHFSQT